MKNNDYNMTLDILCGFALEETAWKVFKEISNELSSIHSQGRSYGEVCASNILFDESGEFHLVDTDHYGEESKIPSDIWGLGASVFELLMGVPVFGGRGETEQKEITPVPTFRKDKYDESLGKLVGDCLSFHPKERPDAETITKIAAERFSICQSTQRGRIPRSESAHTHRDILKFWPEKMI